jgi:hypothetical protein
MLAGAYTVTVTDANGCTTTSSVTLTQPDALVASISASTHIACNAAATGAATVSVTGGANGYSYVWSTSPAQTSATATGLSATSYTVTVTDGNGATTTASLALTQPPTAISASLVSNGPKHSGVAITLTATISGGTQGGSAPYYTYSWTKPNGATSSAISAGTESLAAGTVTTTFTVSTPTTYDNGQWTLTVTDVNGCTNTANTTLVIYPYRIYVATAAASPAGNDNNNGMVTAPLLTIQKAIDVSLAGDTIEVLAGTFNESPIIDKSLTFNGSATTYLGTGKYFVYNTANTVTWGSSWSSSVFDNLGTKLAGAIANAHNKVNASGTLWIRDDLTVTSAIEVSKAITIQGATSSYGVESYSNCAIDPSSSLTLAGATSADTVLFNFTGSGAKVVKDLELNIKSTGVYYRIPSGSSGNVTSTTNISYYLDSDNNGTYETRLFGVTNGLYSGGNKFDVAKFVHDASDNGYGSGTVTYGNNGPLPWNDLVIGWKADDAGLAANGARIKTLEPMKSTTKLQNLNLLSRRPQHYLPTFANNPFNSKSFMWFDGVDEYLESNTTADINSGSQKSLFVAFQLDSGSITNTADEVIYKHGDEDQGMSIVHTSNGDITINVYEGTTAGTRESWLYKGTDLALNTVYVAQVYFNGNGTDNANKRVGAALDRNSGRVTESNHANQDGFVDNAAFTPSTLTAPATIDAASMVSVGARSGSMFYATWDQATPVVLSSQSVTTEGRANFFGGTIAEVVMLNTASEATRDAVYCYMRNKYLTSSGTGNTLDKPGDGAIAGDTRAFDPEISVWPNPVQDDLTLELAVPSAGYVIVKLHDALGREVQTLFEGTVSSNTLLPVRADVRNIPSGAYLINVMGAGEMQLTAPVIVRH